MDSGEVDCLKASGCLVDALVKKDGDFAKCTRFDDRIDCYKLCPDIDDDGEFRAASPRWREDC